MKAILYASIPGTFLWSFLLFALLFDGNLSHGFEFFLVTVVPAFATSLVMVGLFKPILYREGILRKFWLPFITIPLSATLLGMFQNIPDFNFRFHLFWEMPMIYLFWGTTVYLFITYPLAYINQVAASKLLIYASNKTVQETGTVPRDDP